MPERGPRPEIDRQRSRIADSHSLLIVLSGPSGVGKDSVLARMRDLQRPFHYVVTATTRPKRTGERDGVDYRFLPQHEFERMLHEKWFLEWATVYGNYYGVPKDQIAAALSRGQNVIVKVDVQGAATIKRLLPGAVLVFIMPPSADELERRLRTRTSESPDALDLRLKTAKEEMESLQLFDYVIVNHPGKIDDVVFQIDAIATAERCRTKPRTVEL